MVAGIKAAYRVRLPAFFQRPGTFSVIIHFGPAVGAEHQPSQRISHACGVCPAHSFSDVLCQFPGFRVNDGLVGILKNQPFRLRTLDHFLLFIGRLVRAEVDRMPHILWFRQDISDCIAIPIIGSGHICFALTRSPAPLGEIIGRTLHFVHHQDFGYHVRPHPLRTQAKDTAHDFCYFLIHQPVVLDFRVLLEPVGDGVGDRLAGPSTHLGTALFASGCNPGRTTPT